MRNHCAIITEMTLNISLHYYNYSTTKNYSPIIIAYDKRHHFLSIVEIDCSYECDEIKLFHYIRNHFKHFIAKQIRTIHPL